MYDSTSPDGSSDVPSSATVLLSEIAAELRMDRSALRKWLVSQRFCFHRVASPKTQGQKALALTLSDAAIVRELRSAWLDDTTDRLNGTSAIDAGAFYAIQLVPDLSPKRIKLGFALSVEARLNDHRTAAPTATILRIWPCRRSWESAAMASITRVACALIGGEVFDCDDVSSMLQRADEFFSLMPPP